MISEPNEGDSPNKRLDRIREEIRELEKERRSIYLRSLSEPDTRKVCADSMAEFLSRDHGGREKEPFTVKTTVMGNAPAVVPGSIHDSGSFVSIRPCGEEYEGRTYLGLYIGDLATSVSIKIAPELQAMQLEFSRHNPAIWVFELNRIILGNASFWTPIDSPEQLRKITNDDINDCWYVKAARAMCEGKSP